MDAPQGNLSEVEHLRQTLAENLLVSPQLAGRIIVSLEAVASERGERWDSVPSNRTHLDLSEALLEAYGEYCNRRKAHL
jgi:hypothetical protein